MTQEQLEATILQLEARLQKLESVREDKNALEGEKLVLTTWAKTVDTQMHFNDMIMRVRNLAITLLLAAFGAAAYSLQTPLFLNVSGVSVHVALFIIVFGLTGWSALWIMDTGHFHKLLRGAVSHGMSLEKHYSAHPQLGHLLGMTTAIAQESRKIMNCKVSAGAKLNAVYAFVFIVGVIFCLVTFSYVQKDDFDNQKMEKAIRIITEAPDGIILKIDPSVVTLKEASKKQGGSKGEAQPNKIQK